MSILLLPSGTWDSHVSGAWGGSIFSIETLLGLDPGYNFITDLPDFTKSARSWGSITYMIPQNSVYHGQTRVRTPNQNFTDADYPALFKAYQAPDVEMLYNDMASHLRWDAPGVEVRNLGYL